VWNPGPVNITNSRQDRVRLSGDGGGCIQALNDLLGLTLVPECAGFPGGAFAATAIAPGGTVTTAPLSPGVHRLECLIHPWMRTTATVG
jgi:hypothetical protein